MRRAVFTVILCALCASPVLAHHGVASLGVAGLKGPGAPLETSTSSTLPRGGFLLYGKLDYAKFEKFTAEVDDESDYSAFWMYCLGYGVTSWFSLYGFVPFTTKTVEDNSYNTSGFTDMSVLGVLGFKFDEGFALVPENESLDDLEDWHFTAYGGFSFPSGNADITDSSGSIDPGMSLGFGRPSYQGGATAAKLFTEHLTGVAEASYIAFTENGYPDGNKIKFGSESRLNGALVGRLFIDESSRLRLDGCLEAGFLRLGRDERNGDGERATGGDMLYLTPGIRIFFKSASVAGGMKFPVWTDLNEEDEQQGAEGKEKYRAIVTFSILL